MSGSSSDIFVKNAECIAASIATKKSELAQCEKTLATLKEEKSAFDADVKAFYGNPSYDESLFPVPKTENLDGKIEFIEFFDIEHLNADIKFFNGLLAAAHGAAALSDAANVCIPLYTDHANAALAAANVLATTAGTGADAILSDVQSKLATAVALASALVGVIPDGDAARAAVMASIDALAAASKALL